MPHPMLYGSRLCGYAPYAHGLWSNPARGLILRMAHKRKLANCLSYSEHWINFHIIYYPLYMLIMQVYHDSSHMRDFGHMFNSGRKIWLRSYILTLVTIPNFNCASRLWSMSAPSVLPPQLWKTSHGHARWLQHFTAQTLSQKQTGRNTRLDQHSKPQIA
jgi:hypothetical protein